jgi:hypothetical protein
MSLFTPIEHTLNQPLPFFRQLQAADWQSRGLIPASLWVVFISVLQPLTGNHGIFPAVAWACYAAINGLFCWVAFAGLIHGLAYVFSGKAANANTDLVKPASYQRFLVLSAWALTPWLVSPVIALLSHSDWPGLTVLAILGQIGLWCWSAWLLCLAIQVNYHMSWERIVLGVVLLPFLGWLNTAVLLQFFAQVFQGLA